MLIGYGYIRSDRLLLPGIIISKPENLKCPSKYADIKLPLLDF